MAEIFSNEKEFKFGQFNSTLNNLGYQKVVQTSEQFSIKAAYDDTAYFWFENENVNGTSEKIADSSMRKLSVGTGSSDIMCIQTKHSCVYISGNVYKMNGAFLLDLQEGSFAEIGPCDTSNGPFFKFGKEGGELTAYAGRRSSWGGTVNEYLTPQSEWNLDPLDGTGPSGITLDLTKFQMINIEYNWYGAGGIAYSIIYERQTIYVHWESSANKLDEPIFAIPDLPIKIKIYNTLATSQPSSIILGGLFMAVDTSFRKRDGYNRTITRDPIHVTAGQEIPLLSIRPKTLFKGVINRAHCKLEDFQLFGDALGTYKLILAGYLPDPVWQDVHIAHSMMEYDSSSTSVEYTWSPVLYSGGISHVSGYTVKTVEDSKDALTAYSDGSGTTNLTLYFKCSTEGEIGASMNWVEFY